MSGTEPTFNDVLRSQSDQIDRLRARVAELESALVASREEALWLMYDAGMEVNGVWDHMCMSAPQGLAEAMGLESRSSGFDAEWIKARIPETARAVLKDIGRAEPSE